MSYLIGLIATNGLSCRVSQKIVPRLCCCCGGAVGSIVSVFIHFHRSGFNLEFETLYELIRRVAADLWQRKGKYVVSYIFHICYISYFIFESFKEGCPSAEAVFQGALR